MAGGSVKHTAASNKRTLDGVTKEMAKPRMSKSARTAELILDASRSTVLPSVTVEVKAKNHSVTTAPARKGKNKCASAGQKVSRASH
jgi:hypothetical protein